MKLIFTLKDGRRYSPEIIKKIIFITTAGVACDSLSAEFEPSGDIGEIVAVKAYDGASLVFNGYCDCQRTTTDDSGKIVYIYARSSACLLVDSQAMPYTYNRPTLIQLYSVYAEKFGFKNKLPSVRCCGKYEVPQGTSCFGAINSLASIELENGIYVTPANEICPLRESESIVNLAKYKIISSKEIINRSEVISGVNYKRGYTADYDCRAASQTATDMGIDRCKYVNLTSLPTWQRDYKIAKMLKASFENYKICELTISGACREDLYQRFSCDSALCRLDDYILCEKKYTYDSSGEYTRLTLKKRIDIGEMTYVD